MRKTMTYHLSTFLRLTQKYLSSTGILPILLSKFTFNFYHFMEFLAKICEEWLVSRIL